LYVGELLPEITEAHLFEVFNNIGPVASVRVCRDAITRRSLGYAYVNFQNAADADRAIETMNFEPIQGKSCRIMWCQRDPTMRRSGVGNIFVKGLDKSIDNKALYDAFSIFGNILSVKVQLDANGASAGRGFVHFETEQNATEAIEKANGTLLKDKKITVAHFKSRKERLDEHGRTEQQFKNVFVKNLGDNVTEESFRALFAPFGTITSLVLGRDDSGKPKGFGFVCFDKFEEAKAAVDAMNDKEVNGNVIYAGRAMKKAERQATLRRDYDARRKDQQQKSRGVNLYIKNLDDDVNDAKLRDIFSEFGTITSAKVMRDEKDNSRGFGFVCFGNQEEATRAITELNGRIIGTKPLYVALAQPKEERRAQLNVQYRQRINFQRSNNYMGPQAFPQQMLYIGAPFGQRQPQPFYGQRMPGPSRFGAPFPGAMPGQFQQQPGGPRPVRPQGAFARPPGQAGPRGANPNARYTQHARNTPMGVMGGAPTQPMMQQHQPLTSLLAAAEPERQKQILGDNLYPLVSAHYPQAAGKLTGMLLQMDNSEILHLLEDNTTLLQELAKANEVLQQHQLVAPQ
jgi:polyadenylate-binding protein